MYFIALQVYSWVYLIALQVYTNVLDCSASLKLDLPDRSASVHAVTYLSVIYCSNSLCNAFQVQQFLTFPLCLFRWTVWLTCNLCLCKWTVCFICLMLCLCKWTAWLTCPLCLASEQFVLPVSSASASEQFGLPRLCLCKWKVWPTCLLCSARARTRRHASAHASRYLSDYQIFARGATSINYVVRTFRASVCPIWQLSLIRHDSYILENFFLYAFIPVIVIDIMYCYLNIICPQYDMTITWVTYKYVCNCTYFELFWFWKICEYIRAVVSYVICNSW